MKNLPTGPTIILDDLPPRGWTDTAVPIFPDGCDRLEFYARWLGEHLATTRSTPHRQQKEFLDSLHVPWSEILQDYEEQSLGAQLALAQYAIQIVEASHAAGETWEQFQKRQRATMAEDEEFKPLDFENEYSCSESKWIEIGQECQEKSQLPDLPDFPDIPFRLYLALEINLHLEVDSKSITRNFIVSFENSYN